ncbi:MAG: hypothetical protein D6826_04170 [Alphaproteobacteria bacterium]|nr:MAG: hypothetical protein D6826_04170 [Alphaproteobacteria bacterium]
MTHVQDVETILRTIEGDVRRAQAMLAAGDAIDLSALQDRVDALCAGMAALPAGQAHRLRPATLALIDDLNALARIVEVRLDELKTQLSDTGQRTRAVGAYGRAPGRSRRGPRNPGG